MKKFVWRGIDSLGQNKKGISLAESADHLKTVLFEQGVALLNFKLSTQNFLSNFFTFQKNVTLEQKVFFFNQLAILVGSGIELLKAFKLVARQIKTKRLNDVVLKMIDDVAQGASLSSSMEKHSDVFNLSMVHIIKSGENSGKLALVLQSLANYLNARLMLSKKLKQAALLPGITLVFALFIIMAVFVFVIPQFESLFSSMEQSLPDSTKLVMQISLFLRSNDALLGLLGFMLVFLFLKTAFKLKKARRLKDKIALKIFFLNKIFLLNDLISFLQILSMFLKAGVPLRRALKLSVKTVKNDYFKEKITVLTNLVTQGSSLEDSLIQVGEKYFPENLVAVVSVGEQAGNLDLMLEKSASFFKEELDNKLKLVTTAFQPILMVIVGFIVVFLMLAVYLPIFSMANLV